MSRKVETTHLQVKSVKNAKVLGTDKDGFVIERDLKFLNHIPKDGEKGDTGAKGADGLNGEKGDTGAKGADGLNGEKGDTGAKGSDGLKGEKGDTGAKGADGLKGEKGDTGAKGSDANSIDVQAGTNITIDKTNPLKPVINASGDGTDLSYKPSLDKVHIASSTGKGTFMPLSDKGVPGLMQYGKGIIKAKIKHLVIKYVDHGVGDGDEILNSDDFILNGSKEEIDVQYRVVNDILYLQCEFITYHIQSRYIDYRVEINLDLPIDCHSGSDGFIGVTRPCLNSFLDPSGVSRIDELTFSNERTHLLGDKARLQFQVTRDFGKASSAGYSKYVVHATYLNSYSIKYAYQEFYTIP